MEEITKAFKEEFPVIVRKANSIARRAGFGFATHIEIGNEDKVVDHICYGYRKKTTGQYVPKKYLNNFGWKNTFYQHAETKVTIKEEK